MLQTLTNRWRIQSIFLYLQRLEGFYILWSFPVYGSIITSCQ